MKNKILMSLFVLGITMLSACTNDNYEELYGDLPDVPDVVSLSTHIVPIMDSKCAISGCHVTGVTFPDLTVNANVISSASQIRTRTQSGNMPKTGSLTQAEKDLIKNWVDQGSLDN